MRKREIKEAIQERLRELALTSEETLKAILDIAKSSLNDYFDVKEIIHKPRVQKSLSQLIEEIDKEIQIEEEYASEVGLTDKDYDLHYATQERRKIEIIRFKILLKHDPEASMVVDGRLQLVKVVELDLVKLVQDKEAGRIKSVTPSKHGIKVEMYPADAALRDLACIHGLFEKDNQQA